MTKEKNTDNDLVMVHKIENPIQLFTETEMDKLVNKIKEKVDGFMPNLATDKSRKEIAAMAYKVSRSKTALEKLSNDLTEDWKNKTKAVVKIRKSMSEQLDQLRDQIRKPLTDWEDEQEKIIAQMKKALEGIKIEGDKALDFWMDTRAERLKEIKVIIENWECIANTPEHNHRFNEVKEMALNKVSLALEKRTSYDKDQAELEALREADKVRKAEDEARIAKEAEDAAQQEEIRLAKENKDRIDKEIEEAAEQAKRNAEQDAVKAAEDKAKAQQKLDEQKEQDIQDALEAKQKAENDAKAAKKAMEVAVKKAANDERQKIIDEDNQRLADEKRREADKEHQRKINQEAVEGLVAAKIDKHIAQLSVKAIILGEVPNVRISY